MKCFICIVNYRMGPIAPQEAWTQYKGTLLCREHAKEAAIKDKVIVVATENGKQKPKALTQ